MQERGFAIQPAAHYAWQRRRTWTPAATIMLVILALIAALSSSNVRAAGQEIDGSVQHVSGAGRTIIEGGTGGAMPLPVTTLVAFHADADGGFFECLALAPPQATGPGSGEFTVNAMYVTGQVTSLEVAEESAILRGTATVTGIGAGQNQPFTLHIRAGGPGATVVLEVSGLTFREILVEGQISVD